MYASHHTPSDLDCSLHGEEMIHSHMNDCNCLPFALSDHHKTPDEGLESLDLGSNDAIN